MIGRLASICAGVGGRALFGLLFAIMVIRHLPSDASVSFFQIVLLQSGFIALIGGGGYVRGSAQSGSVPGSVRLLRGFLATVALILTGIAVLVSVAGVPAEFETWQLGVLLVSGASTALNAQLMGILAGVAGVRRIFIPLSILFAVFSGLLLLVPPRGFDAAILVTAASQTVPLVLLLVLHREARGLILRVIGCHRDARREPWRPSGNLVIGSAASAYLLIFYTFRETWSAGVTPEIAAAVFFSYRISETYFQVFSIVAAGTGTLDRRFEAFTASSWWKSGGTMICVLVIGAVQLAAITILQFMMNQYPTILFFLAMQLACEALRMGTALVSVVELKSDRTLPFLVLSVVPASAAAWLGLNTGLMSGPAGLYYFQTVFALLQIFGWLLMARIKRPERGFGLKYPGRQ